METKIEVKGVKPKLRGYFHQHAFFIAAGACAMLIAKSSNLESLKAAIVYSLGLLFLLGCSSVYHRFHWSPRTRKLIQRFDHSAIFILIASTVTPIALLALPDDRGGSLMAVIWSSALVGALISVFWTTVPKWVMATLCICMGWLSFPYFSELKETFSLGQLNVLIAGGVFYSVGALFYALKRPKLWPVIFGYHELFHLCTLVGATLHFIAIFPLIF